MANDGERVQLTDSRGRHLKGILHALDDGRWELVDAVEDRSGQKVTLRGVEQPAYPRKEEGLPDSGIQRFSAIGISAGDAAKAEKI